MKLRTSFFDKTVFFKNVTRFAPAWGLYTLFLLLDFMSNFFDPYWLVSSMGRGIQSAAIPNMAYALVCALLLFGDLFKSRMCNALHALPLRRECWFSTNVISGFLFSAVPNVFITVLAFPLCAAANVTDGWQVPLYWLLGNTLQFVTFFGIALFSIFCVGSRFATFVVYGILNFGSMLVFCLVDTVYTPMLYGVQTIDTPFLALSPVVHMMQDKYIHIEELWAETYPPQRIGGIFTVTDHWSGLWIYAAVGVALTVAALLMYRKRHLEAAGDFIAVKALEPGFLLLFSLCAGVFLHATQTLFSVSFQSFPIWLFIGLAVGYFLGLMLLKRTVRVFRKKHFAICGGIIAVVAATLLIPALDLFGIESWMPEKSEIQSVSVYDMHLPYVDDYDLYDSASLTGDEALKLHELALEDKAYFDNVQIGVREYLYDSFSFNGKPAFSFTLVYELTDGRMVHRYYYGHVDSEIGQRLRPHFSSTEMVLGISKDEIPAFAAAVEELRMSNKDITNVLTPAQRQELLEAIAADCEEGNMVQRWGFHIKDGDYNVYCNLQFDSSYGDEGYRSLTVFNNCRHTIKWLEDNDMQQYLPEE